MSGRVNEGKHALINAYTHQLIHSICSTSVESIRQIGLFMQNKANFHIRSQKTEVRMQKKINMYKSLFNKEIQTLSIGRFPLMTLSKLSRIGTKTKPNKANFENAQNECKRINNKGLWQKAAFCRNKNKAKTKPILRLRSGQAKANFKTMNPKTCIILNPARDRGQIGNWPDFFRRIAKLIWI